MRIVYIFCPLASILNGTWDKLKVRVASALARTWTDVEFMYVQYTPVDTDHFYQYAAAGSRAPSRGIPFLVGFWKIDDAQQLLDVIVSRF